MDTDSSPVFHSRRDGETFFRRRHTVTFSFLAGVLLFFLPFAELRCMDYKIAKNSGWGIASGAQWKSSALNDIQNMQQMMESVSKKQSAEIKTGNQMKEGPNIFAIAALAAGIIGLVASLLPGKKRSLVTMSAGILGVLMLVALFFQLKWQLRSQLSSGRGSSEKGMDIYNKLISLQFTVWFYLAAAAYALAAFFGFKHHRIELDDAIRASHDFEFQQEGEQETNG